MSKRRIYSQTVLTQVTGREFFLGIKDAVKEAVQEAFENQKKKGGKDVKV